MNRTDRILQRVDAIEKVDPELAEALRLLTDAVYEEFVQGQSYSIERWRDCFHRVAEKHHLSPRIVTRFSQIAMLMETKTDYTTGDC
jgi:hypothetical protein